MIQFPKFKILLFGVIFFSGFLVWQNAEAATYYVKNGGNDNLAGTSDETAWATIAKVSAMATNGDTVYFRSQDTWSGSAPILDAKDGITYDGSSDYGSGTRATLLSTGNYAGSKLDGGVVQINASDVTVKGFDVNGGNYDSQGITLGYYASGNFSNIDIDDCVVHNIGDGSYGNSGIRISPMAPSGAQTFSNITIQNTTVYDVDYSGIELYATWARAGARIDTALVRNCTVYNTGRIAGHGNGIYIKNDADNIIVEYCTLYNNDKGFHTEVNYIDDILDPNNVVGRYNIIYGNDYGIDFGLDGSGGPCWKTFDATFYGNIVYNNILQDVYVSGANFENSMLNFYNNTIYNDVAYSSGHYCFGAGNISNGGVIDKPTINLKNNIIYSKNNVPVSDVHNKVTHSNNLIYGASTRGAVQAAAYDSAGFSAEVTVGLLYKASHSSPAATLTVDERISWDHGEGAWVDGTDTGIVKRFTSNYVEFTVDTGSTVPSPNDQLKGVSSGGIVVMTAGSYPAAYTYFSKTDDSNDWNDYFAAESAYIKWSGFSTSLLNDNIMSIYEVDENFMRCPRLREDPTDTNTVTFEKWKKVTHTSDQVTVWEPSAQNTDPAFSGGTLPTGFLGTYSTNMVPNTDYFQLTNDSPAKDNGATLGSPFNGSINGAGLENPFLRPQGSGYDIGAYEYADETTDTTPPASPTGLSVN